MKNDRVSVLDLGSSKVVCLVGAPDANTGMKIEAVASVPCKGIRRGVITDLDETSRCIDAAVRRVQTDLGTEISSLVVGVAGSHIEGCTAQGFKPIVPRSRHITHQDVLEVITHSRAVPLSPDREQVQALPREFRIDGVRDVHKPIGMSGAKFEVVTYLVTGQTTVLQNVERAVSMAGKRVEQMVLSSLATGIAVLTDEEMELGAVVIDLGAGMTNLAIFQKGSIAYSASLPLGAQHVTSDISKLLKCSPEEAEKMKRTYGSAIAKQVSEKDTVEVMQLGQLQARPMQRRVLCEIIEARLREIAVMARQQIEKSGLFGVLPGGVVLTGGGAQIPACDRLFEDTLKHLRVRVAEPKLPNRVGSITGAATAVGLARFTIQCFDEIEPADGTTGWQDRIKSLFSILRG